MHFDSAGKPFSEKLRQQHNSRAAEAQAALGGHAAALFVERGEVEERWLLERLAAGGAAGLADAEALCRQSALAAGRNMDVAASELPTLAELGGLDTPLEEILEHVHEEGGPVVPLSPQRRAEASRKPPPPPTASPFPLPLAPRSCQ